MSSLRSVTAGGMVTSLKKRVVNWFGRTLLRASILVGLVGTSPLALMTIVSQPRVSLLVQGAMLGLCVTFLSVMFHWKAGPMFVAREALVSQGGAATPDRGLKRSTAWRSVSDRLLLVLIAALLLGIAASLLSYIRGSHGTLPFAVGTGLSILLTFSAVREWRRHRSPPRR